MKQKEQSNEECKHDFILFEKFRHSYQKWAYFYCRHCLKIFKKQYG